MDDRVQQCPNCGSAVLASALYCVTCGIRLPEPPARPSAEADAANAWQPPAEDVWIGEAPALDEEEDLEDAGSAAAESAPASGSPADADDSETSDPIAIPPSDANDDGETTQPDAIALDDGRHSETQPDLVGPEGELAPSRLDDEQQPEPDATEPGQELTPEGRDAGSDDEDAFTVDGEATLDTDDFEPAGWDDADDQPDDAAGPDAAHAPGAGDHMMDAPAVQAPGSSGADQAASLERATALLDELRQLLPELAAPASSEPGPDLSGLRDQAIATRGERSFDDFASLREAIHDAVHRPRDIEVVLRLSQHAEDIDALLRERDRLQSAFDDLLRGLEQ